MSISSTRPASALHRLFRLVVCIAALPFAVSLPAEAQHTGENMPVPQAKRLLLRAETGDVKPTDALCYDIKWYSSYSGAYVSTEIGYPGNYVNMLRARSGSYGSWEQYMFCHFTENGKWVISATVNHGWVSAELGWFDDNYGMLRARGTEIGPWELFYVERYGNDYAIKSAENGLYVSAEFGYPGERGAMLRARSQQVGPWERFRLDGVR